MDKERSENVLTGIPLSYTLSGTPDPEYTESEALMVKHFLDTLAEVSMAIASRKVEEQ